MMMLLLWLRRGGQEVPVLRSRSIHHESTSVGVCKAVTHLPSQLQARLIARLATANLHGGAEPNEARVCLPWEQSVTTARAGGRLGVTRARGRTAVIAFTMKGPRVPAWRGDTPEPAHPRASTHTSPLTQRTQWMGLCSAASLGRAPGGASAGVGFLPGDLGKAPGGCWCSDSCFPPCARVMRAEC